MKNGFFKNIIILVILFFTYKVHSAELTSVNFIQEGEVSKLILDFSEPVFAERKHLMKDKQILLDIQGAQAKRKLLRGIDTSEFSGSTVFVSPYMKPGTKDQIRFAIQLRDNVRSILEKKENRIVLMIENRFGVFTKSKINNSESKLISSNDTFNEKVSIPKSDNILDILDNLTQSGVKKYVGRKISISVNNVNYRELLRMIADTSGFNIIIDEEVGKRPPLSLSLTNIPWDQALDTVLDLGKLVATKYSNILTVTTEEKAQETRQRELDFKEKSIVQEPLVTKIFPISFAKIEDLQGILEDYSTEKRGSIKIDKRTNNLIVQDTVDIIERMKRIIETLDTQTPQILIESKIVEANEEYQLRFGLGGQGASVTYNPFGGGGGSDGSFSLSTAPTPDNATAIAGSISVFRKLSDLTFNLELMEQESKGKVISSPKVITQNNETAEIINRTTTSFSVVNTTQNVATQTFQQISANIGLKVTPRVTNEGSISMEVDIQKEGFGTAPAQGAPPDLTSRQVKTNVLVDNGSTVVVGGLYTTEKQEIQSGIPFLKDLPLVGWLFRTSYRPQSRRNELMVFMTPRIINQEEAGLVSRSQDYVK
jgi:type IV pilus assembly protein PilQ